MVAASTPEFDEVQLQQWRDEGYEVHYEYVHGKNHSATFGVQRIGDGLEEGEKYAIVSSTPSQDVQKLETLSTNKH